MRFELSIPRCIVHYGLSDDLIMDVHEIINIYSHSLNLLCMSVAHVFLSHQTHEETLLKTIFEVLSSNEVK